MVFQRFQLTVRFPRVRKTLGKPPGIPSGRRRKKPKDFQWFCMFRMQIQGIAPWHGSGIKFAQERLVMKTHGLRKVFEGFWLTIRCFFILLTAQSPRNAKTQGFPTFLQGFWVPVSISLFWPSSSAQPFKHQPFSCYMMFWTINAYVNQCRMSFWANNAYGNK